MPANSYSVGATSYTAIVEASIFTAPGNAGAGDHKVGIDAAPGAGGFVIIGVGGVADVGPVGAVGDKGSFAAHVVIAVIELLPEFGSRFVIKTLCRVGAVIG